MTVHEAPEKVSIDAPALVQQFLEEMYDVEYPLPSCRRLLKEAGLSYQKSRHKAAEADESEKEEVLRRIQKTAGDGRHRSLYRLNKEIRAG